MQIYCFLMALAFVNVPSTTTADYAKTVFMTNKLIEIAFKTNAAGLETVIENIINGDKPMVTVNLMLAMPESISIFNIPESIAIAEQETVQNEILGVRKLISTVEKEAVQIITFSTIKIVNVRGHNNPDEEYIGLAEQEAVQKKPIKKHIDVAEQEAVEPKSLNIIAVIGPNEEYMALAKPKAWQEKPIKKHIDVAEQETVEQKSLNIHVVLGPNEGIGSLPELGADRRLITAKATKSLLLAAIHKVRKVPKSLNLYTMCRLTGLIRSIKFPDEFIKTADVINGLCILTSSAGYEYVYKRSLSFIVMEVPLGGREKGLVLLEEQIKTWFSPKQRYYNM
ncbi:uncharacterized protein LOC126836456 isoform X3 [Adelges cooleyi]|uniref:uncharacterized protein LOC126836456 isoform X3 n=1 Tax=Adelges cooleyi TaxID=133065 RepID=UPI00218036F9|nr:uncharacterized protein LOC126836456 isoform X3 [Adelges cooleyi]